MRRDRGFSLIELIFALGLSMVVLAAGYSAYFNVTRADDVASRRERATISAHNAMSRIKEDIRASRSAIASGSTLSLSTAGGSITYRNLPDGSGIERRTSVSRGILKGATASYTQSGRGVNVSVKARANMHRRAIRVDLNCFVTPRNR